MRILVFEDNLMWSPRLRQTLLALGHEPVMYDRTPAELPQAEGAIVNLGSTRFDIATLVPALKSQGTHVIGHAGHKEKSLLQAGKDAGCDQILTNGQTTFKLEDALVLLRDSLS
jgi:hypothetical protein